MGYPSVACAIADALRFGTMDDLAVYTSARGD
jgi:hypothetical protein